MDAFDLFHATHTLHNISIYQHSLNSEDRFVNSSTVLVF